jgi:putative ABC transport system substrate-binding protein
VERREFIGLLAAASFATPFGVHAQVTNKNPKRIAFLPDLVPVTLDDWRADMRSLGWIEGPDFIVIASGVEPGTLGQDADAQHVVANKPDLIFTMTTANALALQRATRSIPIVMLYSGYPVEAGAADSLARPGRNVTGNAIYAETGVWGKMLQLLREAKPDIERVAVVWTYVVPAFPKEEIEPCFADLNSAARSLGLTLRIVEVAKGEQVEAALVEIEEWRAGGLLLTSSITSNAMSVVAQFAVEKRLPTIVDFDWTPFLAPPHPLLGYGPVYRELVRRAATSVDKILRGASPTNLPIERPSRFELIVNQKTAKAIGLDLRAALIAQAARVIE